jgi:hypothetical protein
MKKEKLTKREKFALAAMKILLRRNEGYLKDISKESVKMADALIKELNK